jgi:hypothetical protein
MIDNVVKYISTCTFTSLGRMFTKIRYNKNKEIYVCSSMLAGPFKLTGLGRRGEGVRTLLSLIVFSPFLYFSKDENLPQCVPVQKKVQ